MKATVCRKTWFNAAHKLEVVSWSEQKNKEVFGLCNNPNYHGHNYELTVKVTGEIDPVTGYVMDLKELNDLIMKEVHDPFDHRNLNLDVPEFSDLNPTAENIAAVIYKKLKKYIPDPKTLTVILYETERNFVEFAG